jgi:predicted  nucleic acid-binding Zn-ribbon protein
MSAESLEKLEHLVSELIEEARRLREDNVRLENEGRELRQQVESLRAQHQRQGDKLGRLANLEAEQRRWENDRKQVRKKIRNILEQLHRIPVE